jgi:hypothetical protein
VLVVLLGNPSIHDVVENSDVVLASVGVDVSSVVVVRWDIVLDDLVIMVSLTS